MASKDRKKKEKEIRRKLILDSACSALLKKGFTAATVKDIAKTSELSVGTIYLYFKNKEDIFYTLYNDGMDLLFHTLENAAEEPGRPIEKIKYVALAYKQFSNENKPYFDTISYFLAFPEIMFADEKRISLALKGKAILSILSELFQKGVDQGEFIEKNPTDFSFFIWTSFHSLLQFKKMGDLLFDQDEFDRMYLFNLEHVLKAFIK